MTKQLKLTSLLLLVTSLTFAQAVQQSIVNTSKSNIKDKVALDTTKKPVKTTEQAMAAEAVIPGVGTVVKKNPGGGASRVGTTNEKGEVIFVIKEKGDYTISLINDGGGAATSNNNPAAMSKGGPVIGVKVGLGKNPTGRSTNFATTNDKGETEFKDLEPGSYKIVVQQTERGSGSTKNQGF